MIQKIKLGQNTFTLCECSCSKDQPYADDHFPSFYEDYTKAFYMYKKLVNKCSAGADKAAQELVVNPPYLPGPWEVKSRRAGLPDLKDYNLYYGVHYNGLHILSIK